MSHFVLSYEDAKRILSAFENSVYKHVVGYIEILHNLKEEGTEVLLKEKLAIENALHIKQSQEKNERGA